MLRENTFVRNEMVIRFAVPESQDVCVTLLGDSRVAFNVNGRDVAAVLGCPVANYAFAGIDQRHYERILLAAKSRHNKLGALILCLSDNYFLRRSSDWWASTDHGKRLEQELGRWLLQNGFLRWAYLGHHRLANYGKYASGLHRGPVTDWTWDQNLGRWRAPAINDRVLTTFAYRDEAAALHRRYYDGRELAPTVEQTIRERIEWAQGHAAKVIVLIPPIHPLVRAASESISTPFLRAVSALAAEHRVGVIDCSAPAACGIQDRDFADPVHLNAAGAATFSKSLAIRIRDLLRSSDASGLLRRPGS